MRQPGVGETKSSSERRADLHHEDKEPLRRFYRRHLPPGYRRLSKAEATLTGWARLVDFAGALRPPDMQVPLPLARDDDLGALTIDWMVIGADVWRGVEDALRTLSAEDLDRLMTELMETAGEAFMNFEPADENQLRLDLRSGSDRS